MRSNIVFSIKHASSEKYIFWVTLLFYLLLLFVNPSNKFIAASYLFLFLAYYLKIRNVAESLLFVFVSSLIVQTGKGYSIQLLPPGVFPVQIFPQGYFVNLVITARHFISIAMLIYIVRHFLSKHQSFKITFVDLLLVFFFYLKIISAAFVSKAPELSLPFEILSLANLVTYLFVRIMVKTSPDLWKKLVFVFSALLVFQSVLGLFQLSIKSPLYKNLEYQVNIEYFGNAIDETQFTFRPVGTLYHANTLGIWAASVCIFLFTFSLKNKSNIVKFSSLIGFFLLITTLSRSAWLGFCIGFLYITAVSKESRFLVKQFFKFIIKWRLVVVPFLIFLIFFFILPRAESSLYSFGENSGALFYRKIQIQDAIEIIKNNPFLGVGTLMGIYEGIYLNLNTVAASIPLAVHNWYFSIAVENGLLAVAVFIFFIILSLKRLLQKVGTSMTFISISAPIICLFTAGLLQAYINIDFILLLLSLTNSANIMSKNAKQTF